LADIAELDRMHGCEIAINIDLAATNRAGAIVKNGQRVGARRVGFAHEQILTERRRSILNMS
jgi:hypothetical protein